MRLTREKIQLTHTKHQAPNDARNLNVFRSSNISNDMRLTREKINLRTLNISTRQSNYVQFHRYF